MSGEQQSTQLNIDDRMTEVNRLLDEYTISKGLLPNADKPNDIDKYLNLTSLELRAMPAVELAEASYLLESFAFYLQKELNKIEADLTWVTKYLPLLIAREVAKHGAFSYEEKKMACIRENTAATRVYQIQTMAQQRKDRLNYLVGRITKMGDTLKELRLMKVKHE